VDINLRDEDEVRDDAVEIDEQFIRRIEHARTRVRIVILDACRDDPYALSFAHRGLTRAGGLAEMSASGALIAYSSAPGQASEDGSPGTDSVYTRSLAKQMLADDVQVEKMFKNVLVDVLRETHAQQVPWVNSSLTVDFSFNPAHRAITEASSAREQAQKGAETPFAGTSQQMRAKTAARRNSVMPVDGASPGPASRNDRVSPKVSRQTEPSSLFDEAVKELVAKRLERVIQR
jgi:uncharacterized caspase-like protein